MDKVVIRINTTSELKQEAQEVVRELGFRLNSLINAYLKQLVRTGEVKSVLKDNYELDPEEQELSDAIELGEFEPVENSEELKNKIIAAAKMTNAKTRTINIRLPERDLYKLKAKAAQEGMPYQTLVASILHKNI